MTPQEREEFKISILKDIKDLLSSALAPVNEKLHNINGKVEAISEKVEAMWKYNNMDTYREFPPIMYSQSPVELNELGKRILALYKCKEAVDNTKDFLLGEIDKAGCKSPLDVQVMSEKLIQYNFHTDPFLEVRNILYQNPALEGITVNPKMIFSIMGIYLRNLYLEKNPGLMKGIAELNIAK
jgi:hypothetical protein